MNKNNKFNSSMLRGYVTGLILGDGYIDKGVTKRAFRIKNVNLDFIDSIEANLVTNTPFKIKTTHKIPDKRLDTNRLPFKELYIKANPYFAKLYHYFYDDYRKRIISEEIERWLNPIGLAAWYMSDGYITLVGKEKQNIFSRRVDICTDRYTLNDVEKLKTILFNKFNINTNIIQRKNKYKTTYRLRIPSNSYELFFDTIEPFIVNSFKYKLNLCYNKKPNWMSDNFYLKQKQLTECSNPYKKE